MDQKTKDFIDNEIIKDVVVEEAGKFGETSAESILERLQKL